MSNSDREARVKPTHKDKTNGKFVLARVTRSPLVHAQYCDNYEGFSMPKTMFRERFEKVSDND